LLHLGDLTADRHPTQERFQLSRSRKISLIAGFGEYLCSKYPRAKENVKIPNFGFPVVAGRVYWE